MPRISISFNSRMSRWRLSRSSKGDLQASPWEPRRRSLTRITGAGAGVVSDPQRGLGWVGKDPRVERQHDGLRRSWERAVPGNARLQLSYAGCSKIGDRHRSRAIYVQYRTEGVSLPA